MRVSYRICHRSAKDLLASRTITGAVSTEEKVSQAKQVSGHDLSVLPDASLGERKAAKSCRNGLINPGL
jgi:hypothetical protein